MTLMYIFLSGAWVQAKPAPMRSPCMHQNNMHRWCTSTTLLS